jgi:hypothetical protein
MCCTLTLRNANALVLQVSLTVAKIANVGLGIASIMFPGVPQIPDAVLEAGDALVGSLSHKSSAEEFACIQDALDEGNTDGQAFQRQVGVVKG